VELEGEPTLLPDRERAGRPGARAGRREVAEPAEVALPGLLVEDADVGAQADPLRRASPEGGEQLLRHGRGPVRNVRERPRSTIDRRGRVLERIGGGGPPPAPRAASAPAPAAAGRGAGAGSG